MDRKTVIKMLEYSTEAYKTVQAESSRIKLHVIDDKKTDIQCYVRLEKRHMCITFRGSSSSKDWLTDFKFWKKTVPYGNHFSKIRVHSGFIEVYKSEGVRNKLHGFVTDEIEKIIITGHSYGAALATLCAVDLEYNFPKKDYEVFLFGSPRVGNRAFKNSYNKRLFKTFRISNGNDIVTKIPLALMGYRHVGIGVHIGIPKIIGAFSFNQHSPSEYYISLLKSYIL